MSLLIIIPARKGSKGLPKKNVLKLGPKPLIRYAIDFAKKINAAADICVSTNDDEVIEIAEQCGLNIYFKRPEELSNDVASADQVIKHALDYFQSIGRSYEKILYLQPTSPFRLMKHYEQALEIYEAESCDMVVSVCKSDLNPYFNLFELNNRGCLEVSKKMEKEVVRRQDIPSVYAYTGAIYLISVESLKSSSLGKFERVKKIEVSPDYFIDIDTSEGFRYAEYLITNSLIKFD